MKANRKILILLMSLIVLLVSSLSISVAWFTSGMFLNIETFDLALSCDPEFKISTVDDVESLRNEIKNEELPGLHSLIPVSSMYSYTWLENKEELPKFKENYFASRGNNYIPAYAKEGYFMQELYLYSEESMIVTLNDEETAFIANESKNKETAKELAETYPTLSEEQICENLNQVSKSLRISLLDPEEETYSYHILTSDAKINKDTVFGGILDSDGDGYYDYHSENGEKYETLFGDYTLNGELEYLDAQQQDSSLNGLPTCFNAKTKKGVHHLNTSNLDSKVNFKTEGGKTFSEANAFKNENKGIQIRLHAKTFKKVILCVYLEGWDIDNTELTLHANFGVKLGLQIYRLVPDII